MVRTSGGTQGMNKVENLYMVLCFAYSITIATCATFVELATRYPRAGALQLCKAGFGSLQGKHGNMESLAK